MAGGIPTTIAGEYHLSYQELEESLNLPDPDWNELSLTKSSDLVGDPPDQQRWHESFILVSPSHLQAWEWLPLLRLMGKARRVFVLIMGEPHPLVAAGPPTISRLATGVACSTSPGPEGYLTVQVQGQPWADVHRAVAAALSHLTPGRGNLPLNGLRVGATDPRHAPWLAGDPLARFLPPDSLEVDSSDIYPVDALIAQPGALGEAPRQPAIILDVRSESLSTSPSTGWDTSLPPVDTRFVSPQGFEPYPSGGQAVALDNDAGGIEFRDHRTGARLGYLGPDRSLNESVLATLRDHTYLDLAAVAGDSHPRLSLSRLVSSLAVAGVPMLLPPGAAGGLLLGDEVLETLAFSDNDSFLLRESKSIRMRRAALTYFAPSQRWSHWVDPAGLAQATPSVSVVLATRRPDNVVEAVRQIAAQSWPEVEIVLVLHGVDLPEDTLQRLKSETACGLQVVRAGAELVLGQALNLGVEHSTGDYLAKMDDDDWYGAHHLEDLMQARLYSGADLLGSQVEFVYLEDLDITTRRPPEGERYADHVAGGTMLLARSLLKEVGGWRPVHRAVDRCLLQAVESAGGTTYRGHGQNYLMHRHTPQGSHGGHTWAPDAEIFLQNSIQQWDGFVLPPQIERTWSGVRPEREPGLRSIFSGRSNRE